MTAYQSDFCRSCRAPVFWLTNTSTGKRAPIDAEPVGDGNIVVDLPTRTYRVLAGAELELTRGHQEPLRRNHFATCPGGFPGGRGSRPRAPELDGDR